MLLVTTLDVAGMTCQYIPPPEPSETKVVIGMSRSLTGPLAIIHQSAFGAIYPLYIQMVNDAGGITVDDTSCLVEAYVLNDNSEDSKLIGNTLDLIDYASVGDGYVQTIFGPTCTRMIDVMAPYCNNQDCVLMTAEGGATFLEEPGYLPYWPYVFITLSFSDWYQLPVLAQMLAEAHQAYYGGNATPTAYIFWQDDAHGEEYLATAATEFPAAGIDIVGNASVLDTLSPDYAALVAGANATSPDIVCCFCYLDEVCGLTEAAIDLNFNVAAWVAGPGGNFGWFAGPDGVGSAPEGVICFATANNKTSESMRWLFDDMIEPFMDIVGASIPPAAGGPFPGFFFLDFWGQPLYWAALQMWEEAIGAVGVVTAGPPATFHVSQAALKDKLHTYDGIVDSVPTILGDTYYDFFGTGGGILAYECHPGEIGQWQDGYVEIVGYENITNDLPNYVVTANLTYPKPAWP